MTILYSEIYTPLPVFWLILLCVALFALVFIAVSIISDGKWKESAIAGIIAVAIAIVLIMFVSDDTTPRMRYKVTIDNTVKFHDLDGYTVVSQEGDLYTIEEKIK